jgi:hypothetical protein
LAEPVVAQPGAGGVSVMSASDSSPERLDARTRTLHGQIARRAAIDTLHRTGIAARPGSAARQLDVSVIGWRIASADGRAAVTAEIQLVLCDDKGRMLSIVNGKATIHGQASQLVTLREQAIAEGVGHLVARLGSQIARADA